MEGFTSIIRTLGTLLVAPAVLWGLCACGQVERDRSSVPVGGSDSTGAAGGVTGGGGAGGLGELDPVTCDADGNQVRRGADGNLTPTGIVCTVKVVVDDETSIPCTTKADGSYRCWSVEDAAPLPKDDYVQVQRGPDGDVALTGDGRVVAPSMHPTHLTSPIVELSATNMWGRRALCYRNEAPGPLWIWEPDHSPAGSPSSERLSQRGGPFTQAFCVYEGLAYGVRPSGELWSMHPKDVTGDGFVQIAANWHFICGVQTSGAVACLNGWNALEAPAPPSFPPGIYSQVATSWLTACAITEQKALLCIRGDGQRLPDLPGRYRSVAAGGSTICAIRMDGTTACWQHPRREPVQSFTSLVEYQPSPEASW